MHSPASESQGAQSLAYARWLEIRRERQRFYKKVYRPIVQL